MAQNLERRHLDVTDKALLAEKLEPLYAAEAKERQLAGLKKGQHVPVTQKIEQRRNEGAAAERAAKAAGSNRQYVAVAKKLHRAAPELHAKMERKELGIVQATRALRELAREKRRADNRAVIEKTKAPTKLFQTAQFATVVIDPPWDVSDEGDVQLVDRHTRCCEDP